MSSPKGKETADSVNLVILSKIRVMPVWEKRRTFAADFKKKNL